MPLFTCVPLGLSQWEEIHHQRLEIEKFLGSIDGLRYSHGRPRFPESVEKNWTGLALLSFTLTSHLVRPRIWSYMCDANAKWQDERQGIKCERRFKDTRTMYETAVKYRFMISPHGIGLDCYRTWEALFLGMIPVVASSSLDTIYRCLPVLIVNTWEDLTPELLHQTWNVFQHKQFDYTKLYIAYWQQVFWRYRERPSIQFEYSLRNVTAQSKE